MVVNESLKTLNVTEEVKKEFLNLQRKHRYRNASTMIDDMVFFYASNDISPRQKDSVKKQIELFRESLFKKLGALERDYHKPHYADFNLVSQYMKDQFEKTQKMVGDNGGNKELKTSIDSSKKTIKEIKKTVSISEKKMDAIKYLLSEFEVKCKNKGGNITVDEGFYTHLKLSLFNVLERD